MREQSRKVCRAEEMRSEGVEGLVPSSGVEDETKCYEAGDLASCITLARACGHQGTVPS